MKWVLFIVGSAGLLAGAGCASQQPYAYYPPGYAPPAVATPTYAQPAVAAPTYAQPYYAQPAAPMVQTGVPVQGAVPMSQPVVYQAQQQPCVPCCQ